MQTAQADATQSGCVMGSMLGFHLGVAELSELRQLREENLRLKRMVADLSLDKQILTDLVQKKKGLEPARRRQHAQWIRDHYRVSTRRACALAGFTRSAWYRRSTAMDQSALRRRIREIARERQRFGYLRIHVLLRREGWRVNHKRVHRLYRLEGLQLRTRIRRRKHRALHRGRAPQPSARSERCVIAPKSSGGWK